MKKRAKGKYRGVKYNATRERALAAGYLVTERGELGHRAAWKKANGAIPWGWEIHHIDFDKKNNYIDNLVALPKQLHRKLHDEMAAGGFKYTKEQFKTILAPVITSYARSEIECEDLKRELKELKKAVKDKEKQIAAVFALYVR